MSKPKYSTALKWLFIALAVGLGGYITYLCFFEAAFWLSIAGFIFTLALAALQIWLLSEQFSAKSLFQQLRDARAHIEPNVQYDILRLVAFAKLWFRKQFPVIDIELQRLPPSLTRLGLEAVREGYEENAIRNMMQSHARHRHDKSIALHQVLSGLSNQLPNLALIASVAVFVPALLSNANTLSVEHAIPVFATIVFGLMLTSLVLKPLVIRIERQIIANENAFQVVIEGVVLIQHKRTPAMIRSTLDAMANPQSENKEDYKISLFEQTAAIAKRAS